RRHARLSPGTGGRPRGRLRHPDRWTQRQGCGRLRAHPRVRGLAGHPGAGDGGDPQAASGSPTQGHPPGLLRRGRWRRPPGGAPRSKLGELLDAINRVVAERGLNCGTFGHAGDGNLRPTFWWERGDADAEARVTAACEELYRAAIELGGTVTGEHGIGVARLKFLELQRGPGAVRVMHQIKTALDPLNLLNPGRAI